MATTIALALNETTGGKEMGNYKVPYCYTERGVILLSAPTRKEAKKLIRSGIFSHRKYEVHHIDEKIMKNRLGVVR